MSYKCRKCLNDFQVPLYIIDHPSDICISCFEPPEHEDYQDIECDHCLEVKANNFGVSNLCDDCHNNYTDGFGAN